MWSRPTVPSACAAFVCALVLSACGGSSNTAQKTAAANTVTTVTETVTQPESTSGTTTTETGPQTNTVATKTSTTPAAIGTTCTAADLTPSFLGSNGAAGTIVLGFALKNTGSTTCHTYGWPGVEFLSSSGAALPTDATRTTGDVVGSTPAAVLTLAPGQEASFRMVTSDMGPGGSACPSAAALQIYAPDDTATLKVTVSGIAACGRATLSPMMPGDSAFAGQGGSGGSGGSGANGGGAGGQAGVGSASSAGGPASTTSGASNGGASLSGSGE
jgi:hypothetical protein